MGNTRSVSDHEEDLWWSSAPTGTDRRQKRVKEELDEFKLELARKHEKRRQIIAEKKKEMDDLREQVHRLRQENQELKENRKLAYGTNDLEDIRQKNLELKMTIAKLQSDLQDLNSEVVDFEKERQDYRAHVVALKDVVSVSKQMLMIREAQLNELREKVKEIEASLAGRELKVLSQDLKVEYEKQLQNIRNLRIFYEERQRADKKEKEELRGVLDETRKELQKEKDKNGELSANLQRLEEENSKKYDEIMSLESSLGLTKAECRQYQAELTVINQLFSQILLGFNNNQEIDIDKLIKVLEENHHLLHEIAVNEDSNQVSALPKVLLDLVNQVTESKTTEEAPKQISNQLNSATEIVENLPKVWKVLIELLSHQTAPVANEDAGNENPCYKLVETPKGPHLALSVSKTFIRLKDLILEKKSLERETCRLKQLNTHLECRLQDQEKRLELVTTELSETWHVVGKLQKKHQLLHTQEKILRYELAQKRKLLAELKVELECSREKWQEAREKNSNTEKQWEQLRIEFASRKTGGGDDSHNSVESGYSDDKECTSEDEPGYETDVSETNQNQGGGDDVPEANQNQGRDGDVSEASRDRGEGRSIVDDVSEANQDRGEGRSIADDVSEADQNRVRDDDVSEANRDRGEGRNIADDVPEADRRHGEERSIDDVLSAREERLMRLESQCSSLVKQVTNTSHKSVAIEKKLDALHEIYGDGGETSGVGESPDEGTSPDDSTNC